MMINNKIDRRSLRTFLRALAITFAIISLTTMAFAADVSPISASAKEEIVYGSLTADGEPQAVYIVNYLHLDEAGVFTDYGSYSNVLNLTDGQMLSAANGEVSGTIEAGNEFIYQGKSESNELPWLFVIRYELDGIAVAPAQLAGNSGRIVIRAGAVRNFAVASEYYENCALQASLTLDRERFRNVEANGATLANAGGNIQVTCASLPGSPMYFTVTADVTDFEMDSATIAALPTSMRISPPDTSEWQAQLTQLTDAIASLSQGMANLSSGAQDLSGGASALGVGYASLQSGLDALSAQSSALISGAEQIGGALSSLTAALTSSAEGAAAGLAQLEPLLSGMRTGLTSIESALTQLKSAVSPITDALSQAIVALPAESIAVETIGAIYSAAS
ncbi:MAG: hypothetical protein LBS72_04550, partial [Oscillospiraceae bacterium]|nr:hypothetical protein [Oscillospiraceae bacterium]